MLRLRATRLQLWLLLQPLQLTWPRPSDESSHTSSQQVLYNTRHTPVQQDTDEKRPLPEYRKHSTYLQSKDPSDAVEAPDLKQRTQLLQYLLSGSPQTAAQVTESVALKTAGLLLADIQGLVADAAAKAVARTVDLHAFCNLEGAELSSEGTRLVARDWGLVDHQFLISVLSSFAIHWSVADPWDWKLLSELLLYCIKSFRVAWKKISYYCFYMLWGA